MKNKLRCFIAAIGVLILFSCNNLFDSYDSSSSSPSPAPAAAAGELKVSAKFSVDGAYPLELLDQVSRAVQKADEAARSASPTLPTTGTSYYVKATSGADIRTGTVDATEKTFSVSLVPGKSWVIEVGIQDESGNPFLFDSYETGTIDAAYTLESKHDFNLKKGDSGNGSMWLYFDLGTDGTVAGSMSVQVTLLDESKLAEWTAADVRCNISMDDDGAGTYFYRYLLKSVNPIASGSYRVRVSLSKTSGSEKFILGETVQTINIFDNLKTSQWILNGTPVEKMPVSAIGDASSDRTEFYVGGEGASDTNIGSRFAPFATMLKAEKTIKQFAKSSDLKDYTIYISGTQKGPFTFNTTNFTSDIKSLTLCGVTGNSVDILDGNKEASVITYDLTKPLTIKNLKITNGWAKTTSGGLTNGGGIYLSSSSGTTLTLADGALITGNQASNNGGGVYGLYSTVLMNGSAQVGEEPASKKHAGSDGYSNKAGKYGGGIYAKNVYVGYKSTTETEECTGGIYYNWAAGTADAEKYGGGGIMHGSGGTAKIASGNIKYNAAANIGGAVGYPGGTSSSCSILGGLIQGNYAPLGSAVYVWSSGSYSTSITVGGNATIAPDNTIYTLWSATNRYGYVNINSELTPASEDGIAVTIQPSSYAVGNVVAKASGTALSSELSKIAVVPQKNASGEITQEWGVDESGKLKKVGAAEFYISATDGDDSNDGSKEHPLANLSTALSKFADPKGVLSTGAYSNTVYVLSDYEISSGINSDIGIYANIVGCKGGTNGARVTIYCNTPLENKTVLYIQNGQKYKLDGINFSYKAAGENCLASGNTPNNYASIIVTEGCSLEMSNSNITGMLAAKCGVMEVDGDCTLSNVTVINNYIEPDASDWACAINVKNGTLRIKDKLIVKDNFVCTNDGTSYVASIKECGIWIGDNMGADPVFNPLEIKSKLSSDSSIFVTLYNQSTADVTENLVFTSGYSTYNTAEPEDVFRTGSVRIPALSGGEAAMVFEYIGLKTGSYFRSAISALGVTETATAFERSTTLPASGVTVKYLDTKNKDVPCWHDEATGTIKYYVDAGYIASGGKLVLNEDSSGLFSGCQAMTQIDTSLFDTSNVTTMARMFNDCRELTSIDLSMFDTSNVTNMKAMFENCRKLTSLDLSSFNTSKVTSMEEMFYYDIKLESVNLENFDGSNVTTIKSMFLGCEKLESIDLSSFVTPMLVNLETAFYYCYALKTLDISGLNTSNVNSFDRLFYRCYAIETLDLSNFDTSSATSLYGMFNNCIALKELDISNFDVANVTSMTETFANCEAITKIYVNPETNVNKVTTSTDMFSGCTNLKGDMGTAYSASNANDITYGIPDDAENGHPGYFSVKGRIILKTGPDINTALSKWNAQDMYFAPSATPPDSSIAETAKVYLDTAEKLIPAWYDGSASTKYIRFYAEGVTDGGGKKLTLRSNSGSMFKGRNYAEIDLSCFDTSKVTNMSYMFNSNNVKSLNLRNFDTHKVTDMTQMFSSCKALVTIIAGPDFSTESVTADNAMFSYCTKVIGGFGTAQSGSFVDSTYARIDGGPEAPGYFTGTEHLKTGSEINILLARLGVTGNTAFVRSTVNPFGVSEIYYLDYGEENYPIWASGGTIFYSTGSKTKLKLNPDSSKMFSGCIGFTAIDVSGFDTSLVTSMNAMFKTCSALKSIDLTGFDTANVTDMSEMFYMPGTSALTKIYVSDKFEVTSVSESTGMFNSCTKLSGDKGTEFTAEATDKSYARLDGGSAAPGYFSVPPTPLTLEAAQAGVVVTFDNKASGPVTYRVNGGTEQTIASAATGTITLAAVGDKVQFFGDNAKYASSPYNNSNILCDKECYVYGNVMSLVDSDGFASADTLMDDFAFALLFYNNTKIKNKAGYDLLLPATTLKNSCYQGMFQGCKSLTSAPTLPATALKDSCYYAMLQNCTSLETAPELPAETLESNCYAGMFYGCTSLTTAPDLPAKNLASGCYWSMFGNCTSLTVAPALPATTLASSCYKNMFQDCTNLATAPALPATTLANECYYAMFYGCTSLATAPALPATTLAKGCYNGMFLGCTSLTAAPELSAMTLATECYQQMFDECTSLATAPALPATTLASWCYYGMFRNCKELTTAPELPATILKYNCYKQMFKGCTKLNSVTCLATDISAESCTNEWLSNVAATGTFTKAAAMTDWTVDSASGIPTGWTTYNEGEVNPTTPLTLEAVSGAATVTFNNKASGPVTYKINGGTAVAIASGNTGTIELAAAGDKVEFYGNNEAYGVSASSNCSKISCTADCYVYGNIMSLINSSSYEDLTELTHTYTFAYLFVGNSKIKNKTGANLLLPATTLANYCYYQMFKECTGLTAAPELPATTLARYCYQAMFKECTGLTAAPELPATTLAYYCYYDMFNGCTGLTAAPELPATTLADRCYYDMFKGCTGLTAAPELPATTLASYCYYCMFQGCTGLTAAPALPATTLADFCYEGMFYGCTSLTAAPELPATTLTDYCYEGMFYGCTSLTAAPELPATTLANYCYCGMFQGCTNLNSVTCLATDISASNCVENWLSGVASTGTFTQAPAMTDWPLNSASGIPAGWTTYNEGEVNPTTPLTLEAVSGAVTVTFDNKASGPVTYKINGGTAVEIASGGTGTIDLTAAGDKVEFFGNNSAYGSNSDCSNISCSDSCYIYGNIMSLISSTGYSAANTLTSNYTFRNLFYNNSKIYNKTDAPIILPATTVTQDCYDGMFLGCSNLTTAPALPATTLALSCYSTMFENCTSLTTIPGLPATTLANYCYSSMFQGCTSIVEAPVLPATVLVTSCYSNMFYGCTSLNSVTCLATDISASTCLNYWLYNVSASGTFKKASAMTDWPLNSESGIPTGWTVE